MNSTDFNHFDYNPVNIDIGRSMFNLDHSVKFSANVGEVIPFELTEVLPGDTFEVDTTKVVRLQPLVAPIMDEVIMDVYYFFVPNRLVWSHWINFMGENSESAWRPQVNYMVPRIYPPSGGWDVGTIADYLGIPPKVDGTVVNVLPFRAYALVCSEWFRSEALMDPVHVFMDETMRHGVNTGDQVTDIELGGKPFIACKFPDYFTSALPAPQRGNAVGIPVVDNADGYFYAPVVNKSVSQDNVPEHPYNLGKTGNNPDPGLHMTYRSGTSSGTAFNGYASTSTLALGAKNTVGNPVYRYATTSTLSEDRLYFDNLYATISDSDFDMVSINSIRLGFAMQKYLEKQARFGGRYIEFIKGFFGVDSPDARLQRTEYLGGSRVSLNINQVEQTTPTFSNSTPLGSVAGMSVTADSNSDFTKSFTEHGMILGVAVCRYHHSYQNSVDRLFFRKTAYDFYNPVFANIGEQSVLKGEICYAGDSDFDAFGYQERWSEYRYKQNRIAGQLRTIYDTPLDMWHLGDYYNSVPTLSASWIREDKSMLDRCLAVTSDVSNQIICDFYIKMSASRPMPMYSIPGLVDHH